MAKVDVRCPFYQQTPPGKKHGLGSTGHQRYRCQDCCRCFQLDYKYRACQLGTKDKVIDLMMNNSCIRDTARALHISINAVVRTLKNMLIYQIKLKNYCMNIHLNDKQLNCKISYELKLISSSLEPISIGGKFITLSSHIDV